MDSQIAFVGLSSDSSDMWMPNASDKASAIAITKIPPIITNFEWVLEFRPMIKPKVVIIPEVRPKLKPFLTEGFMGVRLKSDYLKVVF